jgi:hypothetical protein
MTKLRLEVEARALHSTAKPMFISMNLVSDQFNRSFHPCCTDRLEHSGHILLNAYLISIMMSYLVHRVFVTLFLGNLMMMGVTHDAEGVSW